MIDLGFREAPVRVCRGCECSDDEPCVDEDLEITCGWSEADPDLCTFCVARMAEAAGHPFPNLASRGFQF